MNVETEPAAGPARRAARSLLIWGLPIVIGSAGLWYWYAHRHEVGTDNAYVRSEKTLVAPQIDGTVNAVFVTENQRVTVGQPLFEIGVRGLTFKLDLARARRDAVRVEIAGLQASYREKQAELEVARRDAAFAQREFARQQGLAARRLVAISRLDAAEQAADLASGRVQVVDRELAEIAARLGGRPDASVDQHPEVLAAEAEMNKAALDVSNRLVAAPRAGVVSHLPRVGDYVKNGTPVLALVAPERTWVEANFKETDMTRVEVGQEVDIRVDTYPDVHWRGRVQSISQATGAEFSVLPPQNATGNWVKVVQRVPVRIEVQQQPGGPTLRAGMSANVTIDTSAAPRRDSTGADEHPAP
jgi:membrane fusion protein (multidrug efflux system)